MYDIQAAAHTVLYELTSQKFMRLQQQSFFLQETKLAAASVERTMPAMGAQTPIFFEWYWERLGNFKVSICSQQYFSPAAATAFAIK